MSGPGRQVYPRGRLAREPAVEGVGEGLAGLAVERGRACGGDAHGAGLGEEVADGEALAHVVLGPELAAHADGGGAGGDDLRGQGHVLGDDEVLGVHVLGDVVVGGVHPLGDLDEVDPVDVGGVLEAVGDEGDAEALPLRALEDDVPHGAGAGVGVDPDAHRATIPWQARGGWRGRRADGGPPKRPQVRRTPGGFGRRDRQSAPKCAALPRPLPAPARPPRRSRRGSLPGERVTDVEGRVHDPSP